MTDDSISAAMATLTALATGSDDSLDADLFARTAVESAHQLQGGYADLARGALFVAWGLAKMCAEALGPGTTVAQVLEAIGPALAADEHKN